MVSPEVYADIAGVSFPRSCLKLVSEVLVWGKVDQNSQWDMEVPAGMGLVEG